MHQRHSSRSIVLTIARTSTATAAEGLSAREGAGDPQGTHACDPRPHPCGSKDQWGGSGRAGAGTCHPAVEASALQIESLNRRSKALCTYFNVV